MAQALVDWYAAPIEAATRAPVQVTLTWLAAVAIMMHPAAMQWLLTGRGRGPLFLALLALVTVVIYGDVTGINFGPRKYVRTFRLGTGVALYFVCFLLARREDNLRIILRVVFVMTTLTAGMSVIEIFTGIALPWSVYAEGKTSGGGFAGSPVPLSFAVGWSVALAAVLSLARGRPYGDPGRLLSIVTTVVGFAGVISAASRSGVLGVAAGTGVGFFFLGRYRHSIPFAVAASGGVLIVALTGLRRFLSKGGLESDARMSDTWAAYLPIAIAHPFGIGINPTLSKNLQALGEAEVLLSIKIDAEVATKALAIAPHNAWLTVARDYGWIGMIALFGIYLLVFLRGLGTLRHPRLDPSERIIIAGLMGGLISFLVHSAFHNSSIFIGEMRGFVPLALATSVCVSVADRATARTKAPVDESLLALNEDEPLSWHHAPSPTQPPP